MSLLELLTLRHVNKQFNHWRLQAFSFIDHLYHRQTLDSNPASRRRRAVHEQEIFLMTGVGRWVSAECVSVPVAPACVSVPREADVSVWVRPASHRTHRAAAVSVRRAAVSSPQWSYAGRCCGCGVQAASVSAPVSTRMYRMYPHVYGWDASRFDLRDILLRRQGFTRFLPCVDCMWTWFSWDSVGE